jgi:polysaccharide export outer membrane protein
MIEQCVKLSYEAANFGSGAMMGIGELRSRAGRKLWTRQAVVCALLLCVGGCSSFGASGPSSKAVRSAGSRTVGTADIRIVDVNDAVTRQVLTGYRSAGFAEALGDAPLPGTIIGRGDVLDVSIWEAPPAVLFGTNATFTSGDSANVLAATAGVGQKTTISELMVDGAGTIRIPFAGVIPAIGRTPQEVEREIIARLNRKAHDPQVLVRLIKSADENVTVVGDVSTSTRVPLTPRGERLLEVLAAAGGVKQPIGKTTIQITREGHVVSLPLEIVIRDPAQNIRMEANDVVTALFQPYSFTSLGATGTNAEIPFESTGITLAQALGRVGGLRDERANIRGVFIFRLEDPTALDPAVAATARRTPDGRIPVIYRVDLSNPATFFVAQSFPIRNKDVLYVSNAPLADLQKFVSIVSSMAFSVIGISNSIP